MLVAESNIIYILDGSKQFMIPIYQRCYSWELEQCRRLWHDILDMQKTGKPAHFIGSIVNIDDKVPPTGVQTYMIIDGQQRMTTLTLIIIALCDYAKKENAAGINIPDITSKCLKNNYQENLLRYKLLLTTEDRQELIDLIEGNEKARKNSSRLAKNYRYFYDRIASGELSPFDVYNAVGKLQIVNITLDRAQDDPQAIFESLNSTGMALSQSDLIRNHILMRLEPAEQTDIYEHIWRPIELMFDSKTHVEDMDNFFRHYLTIKIGRIPIKNRVYEDFKDYHQNGPFKSARALCEDLYNYAKYYTDLLFERSEIPELKEAYHDLNELHMQVPYPFLIAVRADCDNGLCTKAEMLEIFRLCLSYIFRRAVCDIPPNSLDKTFATLRNKIRKDDYLNSVKAAFCKMDSYKRFPDDSEFLSRFTTRDIYNMHTRIKYVLDKLENMDRKASVDINQYTIEHILPQNPKLNAEWREMLGENWQQIQEKYLHTIGNLTLTDFNPELSDYSFEKKKNLTGGYLTSALMLNSYVVKQDRWNEDTIRERADILGDKALRLWPYPALTDAQRKPYEQTDDTPENISSFDKYVALNTTTSPLYEMLNGRILSLSPDVRREFKSSYIAYKLKSNFVNVFIQEKCLRLSVIIPAEDLVDRKNICNIVTKSKRGASGAVELIFDDPDQIEDVMEIIEQSHNLQADG